MVMVMVVGYLKGKSAIRIHRQMLNVRKGFTGRYDLVQQICVSTVGLDEWVIQTYFSDSRGTGSERIVKFRRVIAPFRGFPHAPRYAGGL